VVTVGLLCFAALFAGFGLAATRANRETGDLIYRSGAYYGKKSRWTRPGPNGRYAVVDLVGGSFLVAAVAVFAIAMARLVMR
jgi:hypothetical protein